MGIVASLFGLARRGANGRVNVYSPNFEMPPPLVTVATPEITNDQHHGEVRANPSRIRVLLVEDILVNQINARQLLSCLGITPVIADDGWKAVKLCQEQQFDIILMDVSMPVMDGLEATMLIRRDELLQPARPICPIVAYTSGGSNADREAWQKIGIDDLLIKPATAEDMAACLLKWCRLC